MNKPTPRSPHDQFFKETFSRLEITRGFIENYLSADVVACLDLDTLQVQPGSFVDEELRELFSDLLFLVQGVAEDPREGKSVKPTLVCLLFEHKSAPDSYVALQVLRYVVRILEKRRRDGLPLCCVIPIVVYHGTQPWPKVDSLVDKIDCAEPLKRFIPQFELVMCDLSRYSDDELRVGSFLQAVLFLLKYIDRDELSDRLPEVFELMSELALQSDGIQCLRMVLRYIASSTDRISREQLLHIVQTNTRGKGEKIMQTIAEQWTTICVFRSRDLEVLMFSKCLFDSTNSVGFPQNEVKVGCNFSLASNVKSALSTGGHVES